MKNGILYLILFLFLMIPSLVYGQEDIDSLDIDLDLSEDSVDFPIIMIVFLVLLIFLADRTP